MSEEERIYCGHRVTRDDCAGCAHYDICSHCGEQMVWYDMFDIPWCHTMTWGPMKESDE